MSVEVHLFLPQMRMTMDALVERAQVAEASGFDGIAFANENFVARAKPEVVEQERARLANFAGTLARVKAQREQLGGA